MQIPFGPYTLVRRLAVGGMAEVYLARMSGPRGFEKHVVVKQILPQLAEDPELLQMFFDEAAIASKLSHPAIVEILDFGRHNDTVYLAMEFVDGMDLSMALRREKRLRGISKVPIPIAVRAAAETARALHHAHEAADADGTPLNIVHRDVSPQNVLLGTNGVVKLTDFGIARASTKIVQTQTGVLRGKVAYVPPEVFHGRRADRQTDVYGLGIVLFEAIAGQRPFGGDDAAFIRRVMFEDAPRLIDVVPEIDPRLDVVVGRALAKDRSERYRDAAELASALTQLGMAASSIEMGEYVTGLCEQSPVTSGPSATATLPRPSTQTLASPHTRTLAVGPAADDRTRLVEVVEMPEARRASALQVGLLALGLLVAGLVLVIWGASAPIAVHHPDAGPTITVLDPVTIGLTIPAADAAVETVADGEAPIADAAASAADAAGASAEVADAGAPDGRSTTARRPKKARDRAKPRRKPRPAPVAGHGELSIDTVPWSYVRIGGESLGATPLAHVRLPAGLHRVVLTNPDLSVTRTVRVRIQPDRRTAIRVRLSDGQVLR